MTKPEFKDKKLLNIKKIEQIELLSLTDAGQMRLKNAVERSEQTNKSQQKQIHKNIETSGFTCLGCGKCCERTEGDNSVYILPEEIEQIEASSGLLRNDFVLPMLPDYFKSAEKNEINSSMSTVISGRQYLLDIFQSLDAQIDKDGRIHTFGWMLQRNKDGSCIFLDPSSKKCMIYENRPGLCRTYPFYIDEDGFSDCECDGIGKVQKTDENLINELIEALQRRVISDQKDYVKTSAIIKENYDRLKINGSDGIILLKNQFEANEISFVVYDSTGVYSVNVSIKTD